MRLHEKDMRQARERRRFGPNGDFRRTFALVLVLCVHVSLASSSENGREAIELSKRDRSLAHNRVSVQIGRGTRDWPCRSRLVVAL